MVTPKTKCRGVYIFVTGAARAESEVCRHAVVITNTTFEGAFNLSSAVEFIELTSHVRASVPQLQHSYKFTYRTVHCLTMKKELVLFVLLSVLVATVYPRLAQVLTNPQTAAAEGERNAVGREWMTGQRANGENCCPPILCLLHLCPPSVPCC